MKKLSYLITPSSTTLAMLTCYLLIAFFVWLARRATPSVALGDLRFYGDEEVELLRRAKATVEKYLKDQQRNANQHRYDVHIGIVTMKREQPYVHEVAASLIRAFPANDVPRVTFCNVQEGVNDQISMYRNLSNSWSVIDIKAMKIDPSKYRTISDRIAKETADYWACLGNISTAHERYTLMLEDDAAVSKHFASMLRSLVQQMDGRLRKVDYIKLYHMNKLRKMSAVPQVIAFSLLCAAVIHWTFERRNSLGDLLPSLIGFLSLAAWIWSFDVKFPAEVRYAITQQPYVTLSESCCTPAVLFRTSSARVMAAELAKEVSMAGHAKDHILDESCFSGRQTDFNLISHFGRVSSLRRNEP